MRLRLASRADNVDAGCARQQPTSGHRAYALREARQMLIA